MGIATLLLIIITCFVTYKGLRNHRFFEQYSFEIDRIFINKEYTRMITSGFLHVSWIHLIVNMLSLYFFSDALEMQMGLLNFLLIYFGSLLGGNVFSLIVHKNHGSYSAVGASGAVSGIIFAAIALFPGFGISFFGIPFSVPAWLYGIAFVLFTIYGIRSSKNNIGHEAHLGGALAGLIIGIVMEPSSLVYNYPAILLILIPSVIFIYIILTKPGFLYVDNYFHKEQKNFYSIEHRYNAEKVDLQRKVDLILEKIHRKGLGSLSKKEKEILEEYSRRGR
jgi:membrane associated rhomboid family serine protease